MQPTNNAVRRDASPLECSGDFRQGLPAASERNELHAMGVTEVDAGYECSGNSPCVVQGRSGNGRWTGVPVRVVLERGAAS